MEQKFTAVLISLLPAGKNVYATGDGIVTFVQYSRTGYGNEIVIDHTFGFGSRYAHLDTDSG